MSDPNAAPEERQPPTPSASDESEEKGGDGPQGDGRRRRRGGRNRRLPGTLESQGGAGPNREDRPIDNRPIDNRPPRPREDRPREDRPREDRPQRPPREDRFPQRAEPRGGPRDDRRPPRDPRPFRDERPRPERPREDFAAADRPREERPQPRDNRRPQREDRPRDNRRPQETRPRGEPQQGRPPFRNERWQPRRPENVRNQEGGTPQRPPGPFAQPTAQQVPLAQPTAQQVPLAQPTAQQVPPAQPTAQPLTHRPEPPPLRPSAESPTADIDREWLLALDAIDPPKPPKAQDEGAEPQASSPEDLSSKPPLVLEYTDGLTGAPGRLIPVVGVRFRPAAMVHEFESGEETYQVGDVVMVDGDQGPRMGTVVVGSTHAYSVERLRRVLRRARPDELQTRKVTEDKEGEAFRLFKDRLRQRNLPIKLIRAEISSRNQRVCFFFASEERLDLRDLARDLQQQLRMRIEFRQIGVREEAKVVGGMGDCGRELCCSTWLPAFVPVSIKMAKDQGIVLNPSRLSGQCGRLKCCLVYEHETYRELGKSMPKLGKRVHTPGGMGRVVEVDILRQRVRVLFEEGASQTYPATVISPLNPTTASSVDSSAITPLIHPPQESLPITKGTEEDPGEEGPIS